MLKKKNNKILKSEFKESNGVIQYKQYFDFEEVNGQLDMKNFTYFILRMSVLLKDRTKLMIQILASASSVSTKEL